ncbi:MAG: hemerythrin domain-containing protein [Planctomycetota bacterium]
MAPPCAEPHAVDLLMRDHQIVLALCDALDVEAARVRADGRLRQDFWRDVLAFCGEFLESIHHRKEEDLLFEAMVAQGFPKSPGPIAAMTAEHGDARELIEQWRGVLAAGDPVGVARVARTFADLHRQHVAREDNVLFVLARQIVPGQAAAAAARAMQALGAAHDEPRLVALVRVLCADVGVDFDRERHPPFEGHCHL